MDGVSDTGLALSPSMIRDDVVTCCGVSIINKVPEITTGKENVQAGSLATNTVHSIRVLRTIH